ncbi:hypothetical protein B0H13DRAFT_2505477 [Mycena leptocephala]|nr:hypothetical protein B0H13DRAFT_2505477 [Mycena leptocephala]
MSLALFPGQLLKRGRRSCNAPLLVSCAFHHIAQSLIYHALILHSPLRSSKPSARAPCSRILPSPSAEDAGVLRILLVGRVEVPDVTLPNPDASAVEDLAAAIQRLRGLRALTIRKGVGTYPCSMDAVAACPGLHTATDLPPPRRPCPLHHTFTAALAAASALTTHRSPLPALWAPAYAIPTSAVIAVSVWGTTLARPLPLLLRLRLRVRARKRPRLALPPRPRPTRALSLSLLLHPAPEHRASSIIPSANAPSSPPLSSSLLRAARVPMSEPGRALL